MTTSPPPSELDLVFGALSDANRRAILARLSTGEASVAELTAGLGVSQPAVSKHLKVLERAGLVTRGPRSRVRPCRLRAAPLATAARWIGTYQQFWEANLDGLEAYVTELVSRDGSPEDPDVP